MAGDSTFTMKSMNPHPLKIDVVKFNGNNNFEMCRYEVMDALTASNLKDTLRLEKKREVTCNGPSFHNISIYINIKLIHRLS